MSGRMSREQEKAMFAKGGKPSGSSISSGDRNKILKREFGNRFEKPFPKTILIREETRFLKAVAKRQNEGQIQKNMAAIIDVKKDLNLSDKEFNRIQISLEKRGEIYRPRHNFFKLTKWAD